MPDSEYAWIERKEVLSFEEITRLVSVFLDLGVQKVRLTGGEPLMRRDLPLLAASLSHVFRVKGGENNASDSISYAILDLTLTTNGALLGDQANSLFQAGLRRINISLDTLREDRFKQITQRGDLSQVLAGIQAARVAGMSPIKVNAVIIRGTNDDEIVDLVRYARDNSLEMRFIEYMDVGNANGWSLEKTVTKQEILDVVNGVFPVREVGRDRGSAPAVDYEFVDGAGAIGIIGSVTEPFCSSCTRIRLTADGKLVTCLFSESGFDIKSMMRAGANDDELRQKIQSLWSARNDRFSDMRWERLKSGSGYKPGEHKKIEMITLGG